MVNDDRKRSRHSSHVLLCSSHNIKESQKPSRSVESSESSVVSFPTPPRPRTCSPDPPFHPALPAYRCARPIVCSLCFSCATVIAWPLALILLGLGSASSASASSIGASSSTIGSGDFPASLDGDGAGARASATPAFGETSPPTPPPPNLASPRRATCSSDHPTSRGPEVAIRASRSSSAPPDGSPRTPRAAPRPAWRHPPPPPSRTPAPATRLAALALPSRP